MKFLKFVLSTFTYGYLLRFPVLTALAVVGIVVAAFTKASALLGNLFDINWAWGIFLLSLTAFVTAWVVMLTWRNVLLYGERRFLLASFISEPYKVSPNVGWRHVFLFGLLALPVVCGACYFSITRNSPDINVTRVIIEAVAGLLAALLLFWIAAVVRTLFTRPAYARQRPADEPHIAPDTAQTSPDMFLPSNLPLMRAAMKRASGRDPAPGVAEKITRLFRDVPEAIGRGYFSYEKGRVVSILPGHALLVNMFLLTLLFYILVGVLKYSRLGYAPTYPTLAYVLQLLMLLCWGLSGLAFFLDRFRVPVLVPLLILFFITSQFPWSDNFYNLIPTTGTQTVAQTKLATNGQPTSANAAHTPAPTTQTPATQQILTTQTLTGSAAQNASLPETSGDSIILVAANGGGIQAGAWAARVLTGLEKEFGASFGGSIRVVSSVSGGSVGAMYFVSEYSANGPPPESELEHIVERAEGSSLDEVAWGMVYPDLMRLLTSYGTHWDRGQALEEAWLRNDLSWDNRKNILGGLSVWRADVNAGRRPATIFNTTNADTGARLPFSTIELPPDSDGQKTYEHYLQTVDSMDIRVVTAARLSASFPYVSPAARANIGTAAAHIVDGGYYDNYGISSLVEWLDYELSKPNNKIKRVLVVEIHGARTGEDQYDFKSSRGWFYQAFAPLGALLHVRDTGQLSHNNVEMKLLIDKWREKIQITPAVFEFCGADPPLSWHLNRREIADINGDWAEELRGASSPQTTDRCMAAKGSGLSTVTDFLRQTQERQ